ncbi:MAG: class I SAM-dependent methyltransferase family protein [Candidatus Aenigmarchaeota archaeon]|nr:class I SAM-dependent methyltransferase family protein [Candidatus Aenigmarchaeota archaeon]
MKVKKKISKSTLIPEDRIPSSYQIIGDILLVKFLKQISRKEKLKIGKAYLALLPYVNSVWEIKEISGEFRSPVVKHLAGSKKYVTFHKENGIFYKINIKRVMFSKGNLNERKRIIEQVKKGETIVDMFAGIGYFSLGLAKFTPTKAIYAIEKNPYSFKLLKENTKLNEIKKIIPILGDCRDISRKKSLQGIADRIIMGYLPKTYRFLEAVKRFAKDTCIIHYHDTFLEDELWKTPNKILNNFFEKKNYKVKILNKKKVKSFAPYVWHVVLDLKITRM